METIKTRQEGVAGTPEVQQEQHQTMPSEERTAAEATDVTALGMAGLHGQVEAHGLKQKPNRAEQVAALQQQIAGAVDALVDAGAWRRMLAVAARFHDYSFGNQLLIGLQRPDATRVAGYRAWQKFGRQVRKGERGIAILAPMTVSIKPQGEEQAQTSNQDRPASVEDDAALDVGANGKQKVLQRFKVAHVFDIAQTDGEPLPGLPERLLGETDQELWNGLARLVTASGYNLIRTRQGPDGYTSPSTRTVGVRADVEQAHATMVLMHELAHIVCRHVEEGYDYVAHRGTAEVEAQSVAFVVAAAKGLDTTAYTTDYVIGWTKGDVGVVRSTAQKVTTVAREVLAGLDAEQQT